MHRWELDGEAAETWLGLPPEARAHVERTLDALVLNPWEFRRIPTEPRVPHRTVWFGPDHPDGVSPGLVTFLVYDRDDLVLVTRIQWLG